MRLNAMLLTFFLFLTGIVTAQSGPATQSQKSSPAVGPPNAAAIQKNIENFLRKLYAWGPAFRIKVGPLRDSPVAGLYEATFEVAKGEQSDTALVYVSKDGRFLFRGDVQELTADPLSALRSKIRLADSPSKGPANAQVVVVGFSDFQCPTCRQLYRILREVEPKYPQARFVFKDFPLTHIHPWAMTAALAGRCAYQQNHEAFWKLHDSIFENQEVISAENVWQKMLDLAAQAGLDADTLRSCMADPQVAERVQQGIKEALELKVANTPTVFVNGRRIIGADPELLEQYLQYELESSSGPSNKPAHP